MHYDIIIRRIGIWQRQYLNAEITMRLDWCGLFVENMPKMICFYRDALGFEIKEDENTDNVYLLKDGKATDF